MAPNEDHSECANDDVSSCEADDEDGSRKFISLLRHGGYKNPGEPMQELPRFCDSEAPVPGCRTATTRNVLLATIFETQLPCDIMKH